MNVANGTQMVVDGCSIISITIDSSGTCAILTSKERLPILPGNGRSLTEEGKIHRQ